jgi:hypothetical protein
MVMRQILLALSLYALALAAGPALAAATLEVQINGLPYTGSPVLPRGATVNVGTPITVGIIIHGGKAADPPWLKHGNDVQMNGAGTNPQPNSDEYTFFVTPLHAGTVTFAALDVRTTSGQTLHMNPITLAVTPFK